MSGSEGGKPEHMPAGAGWVACRRQPEGRHERERRRQTGNFKPRIERIFTNGEWRSAVDSASELGKSFDGIWCGGWRGKPSDEASKGPWERARPRVPSGAPRARHVENATGLRPHFFQLESGGINHGGRREHRGRMNESESS
jgi:hypothetical protein